MPRSKTPWLDPDQDAPDPVDFALATHEGMPEPTTTVSPADPSLAQALAMIADALKTIKAGDTTASARLAGIEQFLLTQAATQPHENLFNPPMASVFNPEGERDHPRPDLKCRMIWVGYELNKEILSRHEIDLLNLVEPGDYRVTKADGRVIRFQIAERVTDGGKREMLTFHFPCKDSEDRQNHQSMVAYLEECLGVKVPTRESLLAEITTLKTQLARSSAGLAVAA